MGKASVKRWPWIKSRWTLGAPTGTQRRSTQAGRILGPRPVNETTEGQRDRRKENKRESNRSPGQRGSTEPAGRQPVSYATESDFSEEQSPWRCAAEK